MWAGINKCVFAFTPVLSQLPCEITASTKKTLHGCRPLCCCRGKVWRNVKMIQPFECTATECETILFCYSFFVLTPHALRLILLRLHALPRLRRLARCRQKWGRMLQTSQVSTSGPKSITGTVSGMFMLLQANNAHDWTYQLLRSMSRTHVYHGLAPKHGSSTL